MFDVASILIVKSTITKLTVFMFVVSSITMRKLVCVVSSRNIGIFNAGAMCVGVAWMTVAGIVCKFEVLVTAIILTIVIR